MKSCGEAAAWMISVGGEQVFLSLNYPWIIWKQKEKKDSATEKADISVVCRNVCMQYVMDNTRLRLFYI